MGLAAQSQEITKESNTAIATKIQLGIPNGRIHKGEGFVTLTGAGFSQTVHSTSNCRIPTNSMSMESVGVFEEDEVLKAEHRGRVRAVSWCEQCPSEVDNSWRELAECIETEEDFFTNVQVDQANLIASYCDLCPVALECLDLAAEEWRGSLGGIWGGLYFKGRRLKIKESIETQRLRIRKRLS